MGFPQPIGGTCVPRGRQDDGVKGREAKFMTSREHRGDDAGEQVAGTAAREHGAAERNMDSPKPQNP